MRNHVERVLATARTSSPLVHSSSDEADNFDSYKDEDSPYFFKGNDEEEDNSDDDTDDEEENKKEIHIPILKNPYFDTREIRYFYPKQIFVQIYHSFEESTMMRLTVGE